MLSILSFYLQFEIQCEMHLMKILQLNVRSRNDNFNKKN